MVKSNFEVQLQSIGENGLELIVSFILNLKLFNFMVRDMFPGAILKINKMTGAN